jgi:drug/metabolite transporter (DMT)-like permease
VSLGILLAVLASAGYGLSDVLSAAVVRRHTTAGLALWAQLTGLMVLGTVFAVQQPPVSWPGAAWGAVAGAVGAVGVLAFYTALQRGRTSVVAAVAGAGVVLPVVAGVIGGESLGRRSALGVAAAVAGILLVASDAGEDDEADPRDGASARPVPGRAQPVPVPDGCVPRDRRGSGRSAVLLAVGAALAFGFFFVLLERATKLATASGAVRSDLDVGLVVAVAVQLGALAVTAAAATRHARACLAPGRSLLLPAAAVGLLDVGADLSVTLAVASGPLAVVGPLASLDPVVSVVVATAVLGERLTAQSALGILLALAGTVLVGTA